MEGFIDSMRKSDIYLRCDRKSDQHDKYKHGRGDGIQLGAGTPAGTDRKGNKHNGIHL